MTATHRTLFIVTAVALAGLLAVPSASFAERRAPRRVGPTAYANSKAKLRVRGGGAFRFARKTVGRSLLYGALGGGAGLLLGGPGAAVQGATYGAGGGMLVTAMGTGVSRYSRKSFAKADIAAAKGHVIRKHFHKLKGVVWSGLEHGAMGAVATGGLGTILGGPLNTIPAATTGGIFGGMFGVAMGIGHAYVMPFVKRRSLGSSMRKAKRALAKLHKDPTSPSLQVRASEALSTVREKADNMPRLTRGHARRYQDLQQRAGATPGLAAMAHGL